MPDTARYGMTNTGKQITDKIFAYLKKLIFILTTIKKQNVFNTYRKIKGLFRKS